MRTNPLTFLFLLASWLVLLPNTALAQTTAFTYQGTLTDGGSPANGTYILQFKLFDAAAAGTQIGSTIADVSVTATNGVFSTSLDFGVSAFPGANRFLEIGVRPAGAGSFTILSPRQPINSTPYAIRTLSAASADTATNATQLGGIAAANYVQTNDTRLTDARTPTAGSSNYIQSTTTPQAGANFNISGNGTAGGTLSSNIVSATTQYNLGGSRILSNAGADNLFAGVGAGQANTTGNANSFFGAAAGQTNTTGDFNVFFGGHAGDSNTTGSGNSFFGLNAGSGNTTGGANSFFGGNAGVSNTTGGANSFFGLNAGSSNTTGSSNTMIGRAANVGAGNLSNATAIGALAQVDQSNSLVLGSVAGVNNATVTTRVGIGTTAPLSLFHINDSGSVTPMLLSTGSGSEGPATFRLQADSGLSGQGRSFVIYEDTASAYRLVINGSGNVGIGTNAPQRLLHVNGRARIGSIPLEASAATVCFNFAGDLLQCGASSLRLKTNIAQFRSGLDIVRRLRPISFNWKEDGRPDIGLGAEDVAQVAPSFTFTDDKGEVAGVKYERLNILLINAIKEQQQQIERQQAQIEQQRKQIATLQASDKNLTKRLRSLEQRDSSRLRLRRDSIKRSQNRIGSRAPRSSEGNTQ